MSDRIDACHMHDDALAFDRIRAFRKADFPDQLIVMIHILLNYYNLQSRYSISTIILLFHYYRVVVCI